MALAQVQAPLRLSVDTPMSAGYFGQNLTYHRVAAGLTMSQLARQSHMSLAAIGRYERGQVVNPRQSQVQAICAVLGVTFEQLISQPPPEIFPPGTPPLARSPLPPPPPRGLFPRDGRILRFLGQAGANPAGGESWLAQEASTERYIVQAIGDCLEPHVHENDLLVLDVHRQPKIGEVVVVNVHGELHVKMVMDRTGSGLYLTSKRGELTLPEEGAELIGVIIDITRSVPPLATGMGNPGKPRLVPMPEPWSAESGSDDDD
jgi:transcriptional regulator with XRE-family HTH domain